MKKVLLLAAFIAITLTACSDDDNSTSGCQMKVLQMGTDGTNYTIKYGVSNSEYVLVNVSEAVYQFYMERDGNGDDCWIGEVTTE